ncbi:QacE family quaternary ammonium compound efflux SMR transporter [Roseovarius sp. A46]|nr:MULTISPECIES: SMR family transporter [Roseovarius]RXV61710.1 QacE family quaternary ammonium compound efflux SMR transporter [Roseovarius sp. A46]
MASGGTGWTARGCSRNEGPHPIQGASAMSVQVYIFLALAILAETAGTTALQASQQFTRLWPSVLVVVAYAISFYLLALTLKYMPVGVVYAIWSGLGIVFIAAIGYVIFGQKLDAPAMIGTAMILAGIVVIQLFSKVAPH